MEAYKSQNIEPLRADGSNMIHFMRTIGIAIATQFAYDAPFSKWDWKDPPAQTFTMLEIPPKPQRRPSRSAGANDQDDEEAQENWKDSKRLTIARRRTTKEARCGQEQGKRES